MHYDAKLSCYTVVYAWFIWAGGVDDDLNGLVVVIGTYLDTSELNSFPTVSQTNASQSSRKIQSVPV